MSMTVWIDGVDVTNSVSVSGTTLTFPSPPARGSTIRTAGTTSIGGYFTTTASATGAATIYFGWDLAISLDARRAMQEAIIDCSVLSLKRRHEA